MNKSLRIYLFALIALIVVVFLIDSGRKKPLNWTPTYSLNDKIPLGLYILDHEIESLLGDSVTRYEKTPYEYFNEVKNEQVTYFMINKYLTLDDESTIKILKSVTHGSTLFVSSENFTERLLSMLGTQLAYEYMSPQILQKDSLQLLFTQPKWRETYQLSPVFGQNRFSNLDTTTTSVLGFMQYEGTSRYLNFLKIKHGKGVVYLHNQPTVFSNYALLSDSQLSEYAARVLSYLPKNQPIVWFVDKQTDVAKAKTPLSIIFNYPSLRATWLIMLYGMILFIFFQAKRRQRVVPIINPPVNTTVEFTQTIGNLYYQEGDPGNIVQKKIIYFLDKIRSRYYLNTQNLDDEFVRKLQLKSGKDAKLIENIVHFIHWFESNKTALETDLIRLNEFIEEFWSK